jgi:putative hydrolase of the HAD superfamily
MTPKKYKLVIFDLDNTLYDERDYLRAAYRNIADNLGRTDRIKDFIYDGLWSYYVNKGVKNLHGHLCGKMGCPCSLDDFLVWHREMPLEGKLKPYPLMQRWVKELSNSGVAIAIYTAGHNASQRRKVEFLEPITQYVQEVTVSRRKPNGQPIIDLLYRFEVERQDALMLGVLYNDFVSARAAGVDFYHMNTDLM